MTRPDLPPHSTPICSRAAIILLLAVLALRAPALGAVAQPWIAVGGEFQVTSSIEAGAPGLAREDDGDFVIVWTDEVAPGQTDVHGRRYTASGVAKSIEFLVNVYTTGSQGLSDVAMDSDGDFVVVWGSSEQDGSMLGVFAQRFSNTGARQGTAFQVNQYTSSEQSAASVALDADGDFVIAWNSYFQDGFINGVFARRFASDGSPQGPEFLVNDYTSGVQSRPQVTMEGDGDFLILWQSADQDGDGDGVFGRRFDSAGTAQAIAFQVNSYTVGMQHFSAADLGAGGHLVGAWWGGVTGEIQARRLDAFGSPQGADFQVNTLTEFQQYFPALAVDDDGAFVVTWHGRYDGFGEGVLARQFDSSGAAVGDQFQVNTLTSSIEIRPAIAMDAKGDFVVAWESSPGLWARRFVRVRVLDVDADGQIAALNDGLLALRHLFGFSGASLTAGAVGGNCTRCDAAAIGSYLASLAILDVDGDGETLPLTDGLLILRGMFGFTGDTLTAGAVDGDCTRCDATSIEPFLDDLM
jgi:hypothetical protein